MEPSQQLNLSRSVVLASASPRRIELLKNLVPQFEVVPANVDEEGYIDASPWVTARRTAREKALAVSPNWPDSIVIAGDTVVAIPEGEHCPNHFGLLELQGHLQAESWQQLVKPVDEWDACRILGLLQGRTHIVVTGVFLLWPGGMSAFSETTAVTFKSMTSAEITAYVETGEPMDKAGAYGFQGGARSFVDRVEGSVTNVIGLPMERLREALLECVNHMSGSHRNAGD